MINLPENGTDDELDAALNALKEEIFADAYAGINAFSAHAEKFRQAARTVTEQYRSGHTVKAARQVQDAQRTAEKYSVGTSTDGTPVAIVDNDILSHIDTSTWDDAKKAEAKTAAKDALLSFKDGFEVAGVDYRVNRTSRREYTRSNDTERLYRKNTDAFADKMRSAEIADDIITATTAWARDGRLKHQRTDSFVDFLHGDVLIQAGDNQYIANTVVGVTGNGEYVFYDVVDMTPTSFQQKTEPSTTASGSKAVSDIQESSDSNSIRRPERKSQEKFSMIEEPESAPDAAEDRRKKERVYEPTIAKKELRESVLKIVVEFSLSCAAFSVARLILRKGRLPVPLLKAAGSLRGIDSYIPAAL